MFLILTLGNVRKSTLILQKALGLKAKPIEMLEMAMKNLKAGKTQLVSTEDKENIAGLNNIQDMFLCMCGFFFVLFVFLFFPHAFGQYLYLFSRSQSPPPNAEPPAPSLSASQREGHDRKEGNLLPPPSSQASQKSLVKDPSSEWRVPARINKYVSPEVLESHLAVITSVMIKIPLPPMMLLPFQTGTRQANHVLRIWCLQWRCIVTTLIQIYSNGQFPLHGLNLVLD